jgi:hypothetical protein
MPLHIHPNSMIIRFASSNNQWPLNIDNTINILLECSQDKTPGRDFNFDICCNTTEKFDELSDFIESTRRKMKLKENHSQISTENNF